MKLDKARIRMQLVGKRLREAREKAGIGQRELSRSLGMGDMTVYNYEHENNDALLSNVVAIVDAISPLIRGVASQRSKQFLFERIG